MFPKPLEQLINSLKLLPGIGQKSAERLALFLLRMPEGNRQQLGQSIIKINKNLKYCDNCYNFTENDAKNNLCSICNNLKRKQDFLCIVENWLDLIAIEKTNIFNGVYHVLGGIISPLDGIGPNNLKIPELEKKLTKKKFAEVIIATNPSLEGEATAMYLFRILKKFDIKVTQLARGLSVGANLEYTDEGTLSKAFQGRIDF